MHFRLFQGDCIEVMRSLPDASVDSIVTDPPYGINFMGKHWDYDVPSVDVWREALRILKPGGHLLSFSGSRTYHRMVVNIEDAGFEIRDQIMWVYGSGFPKSLDVSKAIDKAAGAERGTAYLAHGNNQVFGEGKGKAAGVDRTPGVNLSDPPVTDAARQWQGWGTALKPSHEPICVARKPLIGTVAANVLSHGTGAINIDACRVELSGGADTAEFENNHRVTERLPGEYDGQPLGLHDGGWKQRVGDAVIPPGRWPANLIHDGSDEVVSAFPNAKGQQGDLKGHGKSRKSPNGCFGEMAAAADHLARNDSGSAARFFYHPKASRKDRDDGNNHPTVKPTEVCRWLLRLVTPKGGTTLDMYVGSGSFGKAAMLEGFDFIGIERESEYLDIARARIAKAQAEMFDAEEEL